MKNTSLRYKILQSINPYIANRPKAAFIVREKDRRSGMPTTVTRCLQNHGLPLLSGLERGADNSHPVFEQQGQDGIQQLTGLI